MPIPYCGANYSTARELHDDVACYLDAQIKKIDTKTASNVFETVDGGHGRIEERRVFIAKNIDWLIEKPPNWKTIKTFIAIDSIRHQKGKQTTLERRYYISSHTDKDAQFIGNAIRSHWHIENKLHWQLDVSFNEDYNRNRTGNCAENVALMDKIALNLLKNEKTLKLGVKNKRLKGGY